MARVAVAVNCARELGHRVYAECCDYFVGECVARLFFDRPQGVLQRGTADGIAAAFVAEQISPAATAFRATIGSTAEWVFAFPGRLSVTTSNADRFMAEIKKLAEREKALRADILAGRITAEDPRWLDNRPVPKLYAREGRA